MAVLSLPNFFFGLWKYSGRVLCGLWRSTGLIQPCRPLRWSLWWPVFIVMARGAGLDCTIVVGDLPTDSAGVCRVQSAGHQQPCIFLSLLGVQNAQLPQVPATVTSPSILMMDGLRVRRDPFSSEWLLSDYFTTTKGYEAKIELELIIPEIFLNRGFSFSIPGIHH